MKEKEIAKLKVEILEAFPTNFSLEQLLEESDYISTCYDISAIRISDALKTLPVILLHESDILLVGADRKHGDAVIYWLNSLSNAELQELTLRQINTLTRWICLVAFPLYGEIASADIGVALEKLSRLSQAHFRQ